MRGWRSVHSATRISGPTPSAISWWARRLACAVELGVGQLDVALRRGDGVGRAPDVLLEDLVDAALARRHRLGPVPRLEHQRSLGPSDEVDPRDRPGGVADQGAKRRDEVASVSLDGDGVEQRGRVAKPADDRAALLAEAELEIELHRVECEAGRLDAEAGQLEPLATFVLPGEHDLEDRAVVQAPRRRRDLDHLLEGQVLVVLGGERRRAHAGQQLGQAGRAREVDAQGQRVDEEADERPRPRGGRGWPMGVPMTRSSWPDSAGEDRRPGGEHGHEQGRAVLAG